MQIQNNIAVLVDSFRLTSWRIMERVRWKCDKLCHLDQGEWGFLFTLIIWCIFRSNLSQLLSVFMDNNNDAFKCSLCSKQFSSKRYLKAHERRHELSKGFSCDQCKIFYAPEGIREPPEVWFEEFQGNKTETSKTKSKTFCKCGKKV